MRSAVIFAMLTIVAACGDGGASASQSAAEAAAMAAGAASPSPAKPDFDCAKAEGEAQELICKTPELAQMDVELGRLYALAAKGDFMSPDRLNELKAMQRGWIKGRDDCWKADDTMQCVATAYAQRIHELRQGYANARSDDAAGISTGPLALACEGTDFGVALTLVQSDPGAAYLQWNANGIALAHVATGSGAKYAGIWSGEKAELFTKGDEALLTLPGEVERKCRIEEIG